MYKVITLFKRVKDRLVANNEHFVYNRPFSVISTHVNRELAVANASERQPLLFQSEAVTRGDSTVP